MNDHDVQLYDDDRLFAAGAVAHLAAGLDASAGAVSVATPVHQQQVRAGLAERGFDVEALEADDRLVLADAEETLSAILGGADVPSPGRFERTVLPLLNRVAPGGSSPHVVGEMVDLLWQSGDARGADTLEELWCRLAERRAFSLLCAYRVEDVFARRLHLELVPQLLRTHGRLRLAGEPARLRQAFDQALADALGPGDAARVYALAAPGCDGDPALAHQRALTWISAHMPEVAERVLAAARDRYAAGSSTTKVEPLPGDGSIRSEPDMRETSSRLM
ncbi:MAG TPA: MEDS domain-containing protein [Gaiellaceae bacterium]|nr:MEDS domain-containing protein [Gaiellaceae bacterium]